MSNREHMPGEERLRELLVGKKVVAAKVVGGPPDRYDRGPVGYLKLSDGTMLKVWGNDGGCACNAGCYPLETLNTADNVITNVELHERPEGDGIPCKTCGDDWCWDDDHDRGGYYRIFVIAEDERINLASFEGSDGNGYYGTGWWLEVVDG